MSSKSNWATSDRLSELPPDWHKLRAETLEYDGYQCVWPGRWAAYRGVPQCGSPATDVDHVGDPFDHSAANRQSLCRGHHTIKTQKESAAARRRQLAKLRHPVPKHPGLK